MRITHCIVGILMFSAALSSAARAAEEAPPSPRDYPWIINSLKSEGISPSRIQWAQIDTLCQPLKLSAEEYSQCRLEKARLQYDFDEDRATCEDQAQAFNPNTLRYKAVVLEGAGDATATLSMLNTTPAVTNEASFRRYLFNQCMRQLGWRNPRDYRRGRVAD